MKSKPGVSEICLGKAYFVYTQLNSRHVLLMPAVFERLTRYKHNKKSHTEVGMIIMIKHMLFKQYGRIYPNLKEYM